MKTPFNWRQFFAFLATWTIPNALAWFLAWWIVRWGLGIVSDISGIALFSWLAVGFLFISQWLYFRWFSRAYANSILPLSIPVDFSLLRSAYVLLPIFLIFLVLLIGAIRYSINFAGIYIWLYFAPTLYSVEKYVYKSGSQTKRANYRQDLPLALLLLILLSAAISRFLNYDQMPIVRIDDSFLGMIATAGIIESLLGGISLSYLLALLVSTNQIFPVDKKLKSPLSLWKKIIFIVITSSIAYSLLISPPSGLISSAIRPCGWIDLRKGQSDCQQVYQNRSNFSHLSNAPPAVISNGGDKIVLFDSRQKTLSVTEISTGVVTSELDISTLNTAASLIDLLFSHNDKLLAMWFEDRSIFVWDITRNEVALVEPPTKYPSFSDIIFSPNDRFLAYTGFDEAVLFDISQGVIIKRIEIPPNSHLQIEFDDLDIVMTGNMEDIVYRWRDDDLILQNIDFIYPEFGRIQVFYSNFDSNLTPIKVIDQFNGFYLLRPGHLFTLYSLSEQEVGSTRQQTSFSLSTDRRIIMYQRSDTSYFWDTTTGALISTMGHCVGDCSDIRDYRNFRLFSNGHLLMWSDFEIQVWYLSELDTSLR